MKTVYKPLSGHFEHYTVKKGCVLGSPAQGEALTRSLSMFPTLGIAPGDKWKMNKQTDPVGENWSA